MDDNSDFSNMGFAGKVLYIMATAADAGDATPADHRISRTRPGSNCSRIVTHDELSHLLSRNPISHFLVEEI